MQDEHEVFIENLYLKYHKELYLTAFQFTKNEQDAEDIVNEIFCIAILKADTLVNHQNKIAWFYKVLYCCIKKIKFQNSYRKSYIDDNGKTQTKYIKPQFVCYNEEEIDLIFEHVELYEGKLFEEYKDILTETEFKYLIYKFEYGFDTDQISKLLNKSKTATTSFADRIRKKIKNFISDK